MSHYTRPTPPPYVPEPPDGERDPDDIDLTPAETALALDLFRLIRHAARNTTHGPASPPYNGYSVTFDFNERRPPEARVVVEFHADEFSSGYHEVGVGPDLGTAFGRMSDDDETNGTQLFR